MARPKIGNEIKDKVYIGTWVPKTLKLALAKLAKAEKKYPSELMRDALQSYVEGKK